MRKLATIRKINNLEPIPGADLIQVATIDGWKVVVKTDEFAIGDRCVYFEIDSFLPVRPEFEFLRKSSYRTVDGLGEGFRLKTIRLRGQISQGLALPLALLFGDELGFLDDGADVTEVLGVKKYEQPLPAQLAGQVKGLFPNFIPKTDQERIQNCGSEVFGEYADQDFEVTLKLDGTSFTAYYDRGEVGVCSRNYELKISDANKDNSLIRAAHDSGLLMALKGMERNIAVQAELMGPGIQGNREQLKTGTLFIFDVYLIDEQRYMTPTERMDFYDELINWGINPNLCGHVPVIETVNISQFKSVADVLAYAEGPSMNHKVREGVVFKHQTSDFSFKAISNTFLLGEK